MNKIVLAVAGIAVLAAAGWSALWFAGRGEIESRLDAEIAAFAAQGVEITHGAREIGGFPMAYNVRHADVTVRNSEQGYAYILPELTTEVTARDVDRLVTTLPEKFRAEVQVPAEDGSGTRTIAMDIEAENLIFITDGLPGAEQNISSTSDRTLVVSAGDDQPFDFAIDFVGSDYRGKLPAEGSAEPLSGVATIERIDYAYSVEAPTGGTVKIEGSVDDTRVTASSNMRDQADFAAMLSSGGDALMEAVYQTGAARFAMHSDASETGQGGVYSGDSGSTAGTFSIKDGRLEIASESRANQMTFAPEPPLAASGGKPIGWSMRTIEGIYQTPIVPSDAPSPLTVRFALDEVVADDALWGMIDPQGAIERTPARLIIDLDGSARITRELSTVGPGEAPPIEIGSMSVNALDLSALGASITTRGDVEFLQPMWIPEGSLTVTLTNVMEAIDRLIEAGILVPEYKQTAAVLTAIYATPGETPGELVSEVKLGLDGITVNGQPVSAGQ